MNTKVVLSLAAIYVIWGSTFTAIKWGLDSFPPFMLSSLRFLLAGTFFFFMTKGKGFKGMLRGDITREMIVGIFLTLGNAGVCWAEQYISSGIAALIVGAVPVMFILFNWFGFEKKVPSVSAVLGFAVGIMGITLISLDSAAASDWRVILALLLANCSWVTGSLLMRTTKTNHSYFPRASIQLVTGGLFNMLLSTLIGERAVAWGNLEAVGILSVAYLAFAGTILAYTCYSYLIRTVRTELASTYALVNPLLAILFGVIWLNEPFTAKVGMASVLILGSIFLVLYGDKLVPARASIAKKSS